MIKECIKCWWNWSTHVLWEAFRRKDPKCVNCYSCLDYLFTLLGSASVKAVRKHVDEIEPWQSGQIPKGQILKMRKVRIFYKNLLKQLVDPNLEFHKCYKLCSDFSKTRFRIYYFLSVSKRPNGNRVSKYKKCFIYCKLQ